MLCLSFFKSHACENEILIITYFCRVHLHRLILAVGSFLYCEESLLMDAERSHTLKQQNIYSANNAEEWDRRTAKCL